MILNHIYKIIDTERIHSIMKSFWKENTDLPKFSKLDKNIKTDVLIIGGGISGILCAYFLKEASINYVLVESDTICNGITRNTTAKISIQHGLIYNKLIREFGLEKAKLYLEANKKALEKYYCLCQTIDCDFEVKDSFVYSLGKINKIENELNALRQINYDAEFDACNTLPFSVTGAVKFKNQAQFDPLKFLSAISKGLNIYEHTKVEELNGTYVKTNQGTINADKIIVTTHFPFLNKHGSYFIKMYQHRSYVIAIENATPVNGMYVDEAKKGMSFRNYKDLLLIGGGSHKTGMKGGNWENLRSFIRRYYPDSIEKFCWATQDCMTLDDVPYIGRYSARTNNLFVATGYNKWGLTSAMVSAMILTDLIRENDNPYISVFSPSRTILRPQLAINAFSAVTNLLTPTTKRCPHLGCALKWNTQEHSWDCPCHGSRFQDNGKLIDNPATNSLNIK